MTETIRSGFEPKPVGSGKPSNLFELFRVGNAKQGNVCPATLLLHEEGKFCINYRPPSGRMGGFCIPGRCSNNEVLVARQKFDTE